MRQRFNAGTSSCVGGLYQLGKQLGRGGTAVVFKGTCLETQRHVAIKILDQSTEGPQSHLMREMSIISRIEHPSVIQVLDYGFDEPSGHHYIVTNFLKGFSLRKWLKLFGNMDPYTAIALFRGPLMGLANGHKRGVIHRDIKPGNLFLAQSPKRLVLLDFGIAGTGDAQNPKRFELTPAYAVPESVQSGASTPASDIYQLGLTLAEMISGTKVVSERQPVTAIAKHLQGITLDNEPWPAELRSILQRAIARDPAHRYQNCEAFAEALDQFLALNPNPSQTIEDETLRMEELTATISQPLINTDSWNLDLPQSAITPTLDEPQSPPPQPSTPDPTPVIETSTPSLARTRLEGFAPGLLLGGACGYLLTNLLQCG